VLAIAATDGEGAVTALDDAPAHADKRIATKPKVSTRVAAPLSLDGPVRSVGKRRSAGLRMREQEVDDVRAEVVGELGVMAAALDHPELDATARTATPAS